MFDKSPFLVHEKVFTLINALPELLSKLVTDPLAPSLERMQIVSIDLSFYDAISFANHHSALEEVRLIEKPHQMLTLSGKLYNEQQPLLNMELTYFLRGQRQYFTQKPLNAGEILCAGLTITPGDIRSFFVAINQPSDFFIDEDLARLNGHQDVKVPSIMMLALILHHTFTKKPDSNRLKVSFYQTIPLNTLFDIRRTLHDGQEGFMASKHDTQSPLISATLLD